MEPSGHHPPGPQPGEHLEQLQHREQQGCPNAPPSMGQPVPRVPCPGDWQAAAGTHPRVQLPGTVTRRCCCGMAAPGARRSGGLRHSSAGTTGDSHRERGDAEPSPETRGCQGPASPRKGQSQRLLVKRAWEGFYPHAEGELGSAEAVVSGGDMAGGDMAPCPGSSWAVWHPPGKSQAAPL